MAWCSASTPRNRTASSICASAISSGPSCSRLSRRCGTARWDAAAEARGRSAAHPCRSRRRRAVEGRPSRRARSNRATDVICLAHHLARLSVDQGLGPETIYEPQPATVTLSGVPVSFPVGGFLQATQDGEAALIDAFEKRSTGERVADLFAGLGTFALAARACYAAEASRDTAAALKRAAPMAVEHRDLYRRPLATNELARFDALSSIRRAREPKSR